MKTLQQLREFHMSYLRINFYFLFLLFSLFTSVSVLAQESTSIAPVTTPTPMPAQVGGHAMIVSPVPSLKEVIATPEGFVNCFTIQAGWYKNAWVPAHRVCQYDNVPGQSTSYEGVAWIESYWACTQYTGETCTKWEWKPGHWVKTLEVY